MFSKIIIAFRQVQNTVIQYHQSVQTRAGSRHRSTSLKWRTLEQAPRVEASEGERQNSQHSALCDLMEIIKTDPQEKILSADAPVLTNEWSPRLKLRFLYAFVARCQKTGSLLDALGIPCSKKKNSKCFPLSLPRLSKRGFELNALFKGDVRRCRVNSH